MSAIPSFSPQFLTDLAAVYLQTIGLSPSPNFDLDWLAARLGDWKAHQQAKLIQLIRQLPLDDPLFCAVSLFGTMDYGRFETVHTRTLAWLLDPSREHGFGDHLLRAILRAVNGPSYRCLSAIVKSEFMISGDETQGRLDVVVWGPPLARADDPAPWLLVIEGKIDAFEGHEQLTRYDAWIEQNAHDRTTYRVFLTPKGHEAEAGVGSWIPMSFLQLACALRSAMPEIRDSAGYHFLRYYLAGVLMDVYGWKLPNKRDTDDPYGVVDYMNAISTPVAGPEASDGDAR